MSRSCLFGAIRLIIHTRMNSFGRQLPSQRQIKPEPKSGNHQMPPTLHLLSYEKTGLRTHKRSTCSHAKQAVRSLYLPTDADDQAADECRRTGDERLRVAAETIGGLRLGWRQEDGEPC